MAHQAGRWVMLETKQATSTSDVSGVLEGDIGGRKADGTWRMKCIFSRVKMKSLWN